MTAGPAAARARSARRIAVVAATAVLGTLAPLAGTASAAPVPTACSLFASPTGNDAADGSSARPFRSFQRLADAMAPGTSGCLRDGVYPAAAGGVSNLSRGGSATARATLRPAPGHDSVTFQGRLVIKPEARHLTVAGITLDGLRPHDSEASSVTVLANDVSLVGNRITAPTRICVAVGEASIGQQSSPVVTGFVFEGNRVHHCGDNLKYGVTAMPNQEHGLYIQRTLGAVVRHNIFDHNAARGVQLYLDADELVDNNVIDANVTGINLGGDPNGTLGRSERNLFRNNLITSWSYLAIDPNFTGKAAPAAGESLGNAFAGNCLFDPEGQAAFWSKTGYAYASTNRTVDPQLNNPSVGDYRLKATSACIGKGLMPSVLNAGVSATRDAATLRSWVNPHRMTATVHARVRLCGDDTCSTVGSWSTSASTDVVGVLDLPVSRTFVGLLPHRRYQYQWVARQALLPSTNAAALVTGKVGTFTTQA